MYRFGTVYLLYRELYVGELCVAGLWLLEAELADGRSRELLSELWLLVRAVVVCPL